MSHPTQRHGRRSAAVAGVAASAVAFGAALAAVRGHGAVAAADQWILDLVGGHRVPWLSIVARWCTHLGSVPVVLAAASAAIARCLIRRRVAEALLIALSIAITAGVVRVVKGVVARAGPHSHLHLASHAGRAFRSGHSAQAVACYFALAWIVSREVDSRRLRSAAWIAAGLLAIAVGWSRVYFRVHWPSDVLAGWAVAAIVLIVLVVFVPRWGHDVTSEPVRRAARDRSV